VKSQGSAFSPDWASPPGDTLGRLLSEQGMSQTELADRLGVSLKHVNRIVKGAASISAELSLGLEKVFEVPAAFWMTREAHYQADRARQEQRLEFKSAVEWAQRFPLSELRARGRIERAARGPELVEELLRFLGIAHPSQWAPPKVAYRKSHKFESDDFALSAWLREGEMEARYIDCRAYDERGFLDALQTARALTRLDPAMWWPALQDLCAGVGVAVVAVPTYQGAKTNGATRWLSPDKALIQLSLRHRWEDIFWFSFFHEAGHVALHRKRDTYNDLFVERAGPAPTEAARVSEDEADRFAARTLIPPPHDRRLASLNLSDVPTFARLLDVAPAIVVGRMQHDQLIPYSRGNEYRRRLAFTEES
jgi:HTH-type transcriptional regulator / antitoxin HigA